MKVVLSQDVKNLGRKGDIKDVSDGYALNYLIPQKLAVAATEAALKESAEIASKKEAAKKAQSEKLASLVEKLKEASVSITVKAQEDGTLFGSVKTQDVADAFTEALGEEFFDDNIELESGIKNVGEHGILITVDGKKEKVTINVVAE